MSRKLRTVLTLVVLAGLFGYRYLRDHKPSADDAAPGAAIAATKASTPPPRRKLGRIAFTPCTLAPQFGAASVEAQCGTLSVAENPALPDGRKIALNIAWVPADEEADVLPDPVFMPAATCG